MAFHKEEVVEERTELEIVEAQEEALEEEFHEVEEYFEEEEFHEVEEFLKVEKYRAEEEVHRAEEVRRVIEVLEAEEEEVYEKPKAPPKGIENCADIQIVICCPNFFFEKVNVMFSLDIRNSLIFLDKIMKYLKYEFT